MEHKTLKEQFEESYTLIPVTSGKGKTKMKYVYCAPWYLWDLPPSRLRREKILLMCISLSGLAVYIAAATAPAEVNGAVSVVLPSVGGLCMHIVEISRLLQFCFARYRTTELTYYQVTRILCRIPAYRGCCGIIACLAVVVHMAGGRDLLLSFRVLAGYLVYAGLAWGVYVRFRRIPHRVENNHSLENII